MVNSQDEAKRLARMLSCFHADYVKDQFPVIEKLDDGTNRDKLKPKYSSVEEFEKDYALEE